jgi:hypothetical protein
MRPWDIETTDSVLHMCRLFAGRTDAVGADGGGCIRIGGDNDFVAAVRAHLYGEAGMGAYCYLPDGTTTWGCIDIDTADLGLARNIVRLISKVNVTSWLEVSRSKGYHVWLFAAEPVPVQVMRDAQLAVGQMLNADLRECNPKQYTLPAAAVGNYVRLPYWNGLVEAPSRQVVVNPDSLEPLSVRSFCWKALASRNPLTALERVASLYRPPAPPKPATPTAAPTVANAAGYVKAALDGEYADIANAAIGNRNHRLYQSAMKLGRFVPDGRCAESDIESVLLAAAEANGLVAEDGAGPVLATIRSGIRNGAQR